MSQSTKPKKPEKKGLKGAVLWTAWIVITLAILVYFGITLTVSENKENLLIGDASHGHFQIELACATCHTEPFGGGEVIQEACEGCHQDELDAAHDSHPKKKFNDPRNADRLEVVDARYCVACHTEHQDEQTNSMGVTLPDDYCYHCHQEVGDERESHQGLAFDSCASAGCHNYHDNRALYEGFLVEHAQGEWLNQKMQDVLAATLSDGSDSNLPDGNYSTSYPNPHSVAQADSHHANDIPCATCHLGNSESDPNWQPATQVDTCMQCHAPQVESYKQGKHGMRLAQSMAAISPAESKLSFKADSMDMTHSCSSCHKLHEPDRAFSSVESCLSCHNDEHSVSYKDSPHGKNWLASGGMTEHEVTCATCHMPRLEGEDSDLIAEGHWMTQHNQNDNLRPNEKMIRPVCMDCHGLAFSIDALADPHLIKNNFNGRPMEHIPSIDWAIKRELGN